MDEVEEIIKFLPCSIDNMCEVEEWLDAMSLEGYLVKKEAINLLFGVFEKNPDKKRYYHFLMAGMKSSHDQSVFRLDEKTIRHYEKERMEFVGKVCGYFLFRTDRLDVIQKVADESEKDRKISLMKHEILEIVIMTIFALILFQGLYIFKISDLADVIGDCLNFILVMILLCLGVEIYGTYEDLNDEHKLRPTYLRKVKVKNPISELIFKALFFIVIVLFLWLVILQDISMKF